MSCSRAGKAGGQAKQNGAHQINKHPKKLRARRGAGGGSQGAVRQEEKAQGVPEHGGCQLAGAGSRRVTLLPGCHRAALLPGCLSARLLPGRLPGHGAGRAAGVGWGGPQPGLRAPGRHGQARGEGGGDSRLTLLLLLCLCPAASTPAVGGLGAGGGQGRSVQHAPSLLHPLCPLFCLGRGNAAGGQGPAPRTHRAGGPAVLAHATAPPFVGGS